MNPHRLSTAFLLAFLMLLGGYLSLAAAQTPVDDSSPGSDLTVLFSGPTEVVLELTVTGFEVETIEQAGETYQQVVIPELGQTTQPGAPQVPVLGQMLGVGTPEGVQMELLAAEYDTLSGYRLYPAPALELSREQVRERFAPDQALYARDQFYPGQPAALGQTGLLREQAVAQLRFYPVQYNPARSEIRLYRRLRVRVTWPPPLSRAAQNQRPASPIYERLLQNSLLNYDALSRPPVAASEPGRATAAPLAVANSATNTLKIQVSEDGIYELLPTDLTGAGFDLSGVALSEITMENKGAEIPIYTHDANGNDQFDGSDYLLFYGTAITDFFTTENVYWLTAGTGPGLRMTVRQSPPQGGSVPVHFPATLHAEEENFLWIDMPNSQTEDSWFWGNKFSAPMTRSYALTLSHISTAAPTSATVRVELRERSAPEHRTRLYLNGVEIADETWGATPVNEQNAYTIEATNVPHSLLVSGTNLLTIEAVAGSLNQFHLDWIEIDYWDQYVAEQSELQFRPPQSGAYQFEVSNFQQAEIQLFDITSPTNVGLISGTTIVDTGGAYRLEFEETAPAETRYLALTPARRKSPASITLDEPSTWRDPNNGADYIIITHQDFYAEAQRLAAHRAVSSSLSVATVKVEDIFDEFNHGVFNPQALRDFLSYAYHDWTIGPAPTYVLLFGGASYDYRDLLNLNREDYVPTKITDTEQLAQVPSDNWFGQVSGSDLIPDFLIGRLTPQNNTEAERMVDKIITYETNPPASAWNNRVLLVADDADQQEDPQIFKSASQNLAAQLPFYYTTTTVYIDDYETGDDPNGDISAGINSGSLLVNYTGHGNVERWGNWSKGQFFTANNINNLSNTPSGSASRLPVVTVGNCLNGYFVGSNVSAAEQFMRLDNKGAVAVWAPSGLGFTAGHKVVLESFYEAIFQADQYDLGAATTQAKLAAFSQSDAWAEMVVTFILFGDPAMQVALPANYPYVEQTTPAAGVTDVAVHEAIEITFNKPLSPTTANLTGSGAAGLTLTPTWSLSDTVVSFAHSDFPYGQTLTFTIEGQDKLGNPLGPGLVPATWSFTTVPSVALTALNVTGPSLGMTQTIYTFDAFIQPPDATTPIYIWQATDYPQPITDSNQEELPFNTMTFTWATPGPKQITVTAVNVAGQMSDTHLITIQTAAGDHRVYLPVLLKMVSH